MNLRNNARSKLSKVKIRDAFLGICAEKGMDRATVQDICRMAGINRTTFYAYYSDVYALRDCIEDEFFKEAVKHCAGVSNSAALSGALTFMLENADVFNACAKGDSLRLIERCLEIIRPDIERRMDEAGTNRAYAVDFIIAGARGLLDSWIRGGFSQDVDEIVSALAEMLNRAARTNLIKDARPLD